MADAEKIRVTVAEFLAMPEPSGIVELIDGEVFETIPIHDHQILVRAIVFILLQFKLGGQILFAPLRVYFGEDILEPDVFWISPINPHCVLGEDRYWHGAPDLVVEVLSPSTGRRDRREKFQIYQQYGVREYWIVNPVEEAIELYQLREGKFIQIRILGPSDTFTSPVLAREIAFDAIFNDSTEEP